MGRPSNRSAVLACLAMKKEWTTSAAISKSLGLSIREVAAHLKFYARKGWAEFDPDSGRESSGSRRGGFWRFCDPFEPPEGGFRGRI